MGEKVLTYETRDIFETIGKLKLALAVEGEGEIKEPLRSTLFFAQRQLQDLIRSRVYEANDDDLDPTQQPTPQQWLRRFNRLTPHERIKWIERIIKTDRVAQDCFAKDHDSIINLLQEMERRLMDYAPKDSAEGVRISQQINAVKEFALELVDSTDVIIQSIGWKLMGVFNG